MMQPEPQCVEQPEQPQQVEQPEQLAYEMPGDDIQQPQPDQLKFVHESSVGDSAMHNESAAMHNESAMRRLEELPVEGE